MPIDPRSSSDIPAAPPMAPPAPPTRPTAPPSSSGAAEAPTASAPSQGRPAAHRARWIAGVGAVVATGAIVGAMMAGDDGSTATVGSVQTSSNADRQLTDALVDDSGSVVDSAPALGGRHHDQRGGQAGVGGSAAVPAAPSGVPNASSRGS
ncbi:MAG: hypothetical protein R2710_06160 [Acidimicrobiales bacterium]